MLDYLDWDTDGNGAFEASSVGAVGNDNDDLGGIVGDGAGIDKSL
jgi:hypothetical protein